MTQTHSIGQAVVYKEHTLGVMMGGNVMQVLNSSVLQGAPFFQDSLLHVSDAETRGATIEDFDTYRVVYHPSYLVEK